MRRIPTWPADPARLPLISPGIAINIGGVIAFITALCWWSFAPAPNYLVLVTLLAAGWVILWATGTFLRQTDTHRWRPYQPLTGRVRGRDSRVSQLRALVEEQDRPERADVLHTLVGELVEDRLASRLPSAARASADVTALLGADVVAYLHAPPGQRRIALRDLDHLLTRLERI